MTQYTSNLVESGTRKYIRMMLIRSHRFRERHYNIMFNLTVGLLFFGLVGGVLYYKHVTKEKRSDKYRRKLESRRYVIDKLSNYNRANMRIDGAYNTPVSSNHPELGLFSDFSGRSSSVSQSQVMDGGNESKMDEERYHVSEVRKEKEEEIKRALGGGMRVRQVHEVPRAPSKGRVPSRWMRSMIDGEAVGNYEIPKYTGALGAIEASLK